jgi:hypothetical protein
MLRTETDKLARFESLTEAAAKNAIEIACSADRSVLQGETGASSAQLQLLLLLLPRSLLSLCHSTAHINCDVTYPVAAS